MNAAILCPGPSLAQLLAIPAADVVIAVNHAAFRYEADWWAALDIPLIHEGLPKLVGSPRIFMREEHQRYYPDWPSMSVELIAGFCPMVHELALYTVPATLIFAAYLGANAIDLYGCDMAGTGSFDGTTNEARTDDRWRRELKLFTAAVHWLAERGVSVKRWT